MDSEVWQYPSYLLWRHIKRYCPEVHLLIGVNAGDYEEDTRPLCTSLQQTTKPEDDSPLVFLHHLPSVVKSRVTHSRAVSAIRGNDHAGEAYNAY